MCWYFFSSIFEQYRDNTDNCDNFGHYNRDKKCSCCYNPNICIHTHIHMFYIVGYQGPNQI